MISSILIPTDFSPASWKATQLGIELFQRYEETKLSLLHVYPIATKYQEDIEDTEKKIEHMKNRMIQLSNDLNEKITDAIENVVLPGNVNDVMLEYIENNRFDLVIVGINSNGQNNDIGSHTINVIEKSGVPVMIVPNR